MTEETPSATVITLAPKRAEQMSAYQFFELMSDDRQPDVWRPSHQACHLIVKIQATATYLGYVDPTRDGYAWTAARKTEGVAAFRQLFLHADETWKRCREIEKKLDRQTRIAQTLRARLKHERAKSPQASLP